jgi:adenylyltransferase/sulfurtransferase
MNNYELITVKELKKYFDNNKDFILIDVRENFELEIASISHSIHIPMKDISNKINELDKNKETIIICKSGIRSAKVCEFLYKNDFLNLKNLIGGINAWSIEIDNSIPLY